MSHAHLSLARLPAKQSRNSGTAVNPRQAIDGLQFALHRRAISLRCRSAELAHALQRFRERQAEIDAGTARGLFDAPITMPPVAAGWLSDSLAA